MYCCTALSGLALSAVPLLCLLAQNSILLRANVLPAQAIRFFTPATLAVAAASRCWIAACCAAGARRRGRARGGEPRHAAVACFALAAALTATWLLTPLNTETRSATRPATT